MALTLVLAGFAYFGGLLRTTFFLATSLGMPKHTVIAAVIIIMKNDNQDSIQSTTTGHSIPRTTLMFFVHNHGMASATILPIPRLLLVGWFQWSSSFTWTASACEKPLDDCGLRPKCDAYSFLIPVNCGSICITSLLGTKVLLTACVCTCKREGQRSAVVWKWWQQCWGMNSYWPRNNGTLMAWSSLWWGCILA